MYFSCIFLTFPTRTSIMKQHTFIYENSTSFCQELEKFQSTVGAYSHAMYFQVLSETLDRTPIDEIWNDLDDYFPSVPKMGLSTNGAITNSKSIDDILVTATWFEEATTKFQFVCIDCSQSNLSEATSALIEQINATPWIKAIELYHTLPKSSTAFLCKSISQLRENISVCGGIACSSDLQGDKSWVRLNRSAMIEHGMIALFLGGDNFHCSMRKISGWQPLGKTFQVTKIKGNVLYELDHEPAFEVYSKYLNISNDDDFFINALDFPMLFHKNGVTITRAAGVSHPDGSVVMSADIDQGATVRLSYGEPLMILDHVYQNLKNLSEFQPDLIQVISCGARKTFWSEHPSYDELAQLSSLAPNRGFFSHGEYLREKNHFNQHNITIVLAAYREGEIDSSKPQIQISSPIDKSVRLPLAFRMATFIRETSFELERMCNHLESINQQLQEVATIDSLTGLENRFSFDAMVKRVWNESDASQNWTMIMLDLNGLKHTNDTLGHEAGDTLIQTAADVLLYSYGRKGKCFRIGGDEFVVLINVTSTQLKFIQDRMATLICEYNLKGKYHLSIAQGSSLLWDENGVRKSISDWKLEADLKMYKDKSLSKDRRI